MVAYRDQLSVTFLSLKSLISTRIKDIHKNCFPKLLFRSDPAKWPSDVKSCDLCDDIQGKSPRQPHDIFFDFLLNRC